MREERGLDGKAISACLAAHYGLEVASITFLPIGNDFQASVYRVVTTDGVDYFLKVRFGPVFAPGLLVPRALVDLGIANILAPLRTNTSALWCTLDEPEGSTIVLYPFIRGENAKLAGLSDEQWRAFGATLRAVHQSGLEARFRGLLRGENFTLPAAAVVRRLLADLESVTFASPAAARFARFWRDHAARIESLLARAEELGGGLRGKTFDHVLCHADIHGANILVGDDNRVWLVDWDGPLIAPRERDLLFVVGSRIGRHVTPQEEDSFFAGYGPIEIDAEALVYYRYERRIEDLGETGARVFRDPHLSERARAEQAVSTMAFFALGGDFDVAETVPCRRWPRPSA
jgi:spectinomycin phosphotransferase